MTKNEQQIELYDLNVGSSNEKPKQLLKNDDQYKFIFNYFESSIFYLNHTQNHLNTCVALELSKNIILSNLNETIRYKVDHFSFKINESGIVEKVKIYLKRESYGNY